MSDASAHTHTPEPIKKLMQLQIERLKKEDDEEQWISGEELYTEGSSDEDDTATRVKRKGRDERVRMHRKIKDIRDRVDIVSLRGKHIHRRDLHSAESHKKIPPSSIIPIEPTHSEEPTPVEDEKKDVSEECGDRLTEADVKEKILAENVEEEAAGGATLSEPEISWRPKRGSIKLPSLNYEGRLELVANSHVQQSFLPTDA